MIIEPFIEYAVLVAGKDQNIADLKARLNSFLSFYEEIDLNALDVATNDKCVRVEENQPSRSPTVSKRHTIELKQNARISISMNKTALACLLCWIDYM